MKILLDSHALVWFLTGDRKCSAQARASIEDREVTAFVSAASAWEIATKVRAGKWPEAKTIAAQFEAVLIAHHFRGLPVTIRHGNLAGTLPGSHRDPFDRMLAAQAISEDMPLVTADPAFRTFDVRTVW